jgi:bifunctional non-homologous end joining protein LigD
MTTRWRFVVQEHHASRLHWDFRLEMAGCLKSWAVPKGPSLDPSQKRLAVAVPDHDIEHADYEGIIPEGSYGAGPVLIWDKGTYSLLEGSDPLAAWKRGNISFRLNGSLLKGDFVLVKMKGASGGKAWLLIKKKDAYAKDGWQTPVLLTPERRKTLKVKAPLCSLKE